MPPAPGVPNGGLRACAQTAVERTPGHSSPTETVVKLSPIPLDLVAVLQRLPLTARTASLCSRASLDPLPELSATLTRLRDRPLCLRCSRSLALQTPKRVKQPYCFP